jgi:hypothetical protein
VSGPGRFPGLFSPCDVGPVRVRNRVVSTSHQTSLVHDHLPTEDLLNANVPPFPKFTSSGAF